MLSEPSPQRGRRPSAGLTNAGKPPATFFDLGKRQAGLGASVPSVEPSPLPLLSKQLREQGGIERLLDKLRAENASAKLPASDFRSEMEWLKSHQREYSGRWVAVLGGQLLAAGESAESVLRQATQKGAELPLVVKMPDPETPAFGGW